MYQSPNEFCLYLASPNLCSESQVLDYETLIVESNVYVLYLYLFGLDTSRNWKRGKNVGALYIDGKCHVFYGQFFLAPGPWILSDQDRFYCPSPICQAISLGSKRLVQACGHQCSILEGAEVWCHPIEGPVELYVGTPNPYPRNFGACLFFLMFFWIIQINWSCLFCSQLSTRFS